MFKSKRRPIVTPQSEHARLSGTLASLWGNEDFDRPALDFASFILGVTFHDRGYRPFDNSPIGEAPPDVWAQTQRDGLRATIENPVVDLVCLFHIRRLLGYSDSSEAAALVDLANSRIQQSLSKTRHTLNEFEWADRITRVCDGTAFAFAFEEPTQIARPVSARRDSEETVMVEFSVDGEGLIKAEPWPFSVDQYAGFILGYELAGYPERLEPVYMPFLITR